MRISDWSSDVCSSDLDRIDIVADGFDAAVQIGAGEDSSLRMSRLFCYSLPLIAAPSLLDRLGVPAHPEELPRYPAIRPTHIPWGNDWEFHRGTEKVPLQVQGKRSEEHTSELQSLIRISSAVFCFKKKIQT